MPQEQSRRNSSTVWAASVFIRGCHDIRYLNLPSTDGALTIFMVPFDASSFCHASENRRDEVSPGQTPHRGTVIGHKDGTTAFGADSRQSPFRGWSGYPPEC